MIAKLSAILPFILVASAAPSNIKRADNQQIHINGDGSKCLSVDKLENGSPVVNVACNSGLRNGWTIQNGNNANGIQLTGTNFCLDSGVPATNNGRLKIWQCYPGAPQQTWWYTDDKHIAITGGNQCIDVGQDYVQTYQCIGYNTNQIWTVGAGTTPPSSSSSAPSSTSSAPPTPTGTLIHFKGDVEGCLQIAQGYWSVGAGLTVANCATNNAEQLAVQQFDITRNVAGPIRLSSRKDLCLAAKSGGWTNGSGVTIEVCNGQGNQQWYYTTDNHIAVVGGNQCLNVRLESSPSYSGPFFSLRNAQTWACSGSDPQQVFTI